jgi:transcriptional regulator with XRE-family HTH domain
VDVADNITRQRELYGASIGECLQRITGSLGLSQAAVARTAGISEPMLSQLASGHRIKIGNPQAAARFSSLLQLVDDVEAGLAHEQVAERVAAISREEAVPLTGTREATSTVPAPLDVAAAVSGVLRAVASGRELAAAAAALEKEHPGVAEVLRAYGTGSLDDARRHHASIAHLG